MPNRFIRDMREVYGAREINPLTEAERKTQRETTISVDWTDPDLKRITRLRLLSDPGYPAWDVSYCTGELKDGTLVRVSVPFGNPNAPLRKGQPLTVQIVRYAKRDGVYAKGLGILDVISTLQ